MNSMYGKTIIKPLETYTVVKFNKDVFEKCIYYNYNYIDSVIQFNGTYYIKTVKSILSHYNYVHCGWIVCSDQQLILMLRYITKIPILYIWTKKMLIWFTASRWWARTISCSFSRNRKRMWWGLWNWTFIFR